MQRNFLMKVNVCCPYKYAPTFLTDKNFGVACYKQLIIYIPLHLNKTVFHVYSPNLDGGLTTLPDLDTVVAGIKTFAAGFKVFLMLCFFGCTDAFLICGIGSPGVGSAKPKAGLSRSTEMVCSFPPTLTTKNFPSLFNTRNGPSYGRSMGVRLAPWRTKKRVRPS